MKGKIQFCPHKAIVLLILLVSAAIQSCAPSISFFNETAYQQAINLKVISMDLIRHAEEPYDEYAHSIETLKLELKKAYEFANGLPDNEYSASLWKTMIDPGEHMMGGFLHRWEDSGTLSVFFIDEAAENIEEGFDIIIGLESGKIARGK